LPRLTSFGDAKRRRVVDDLMNDGAANRENKAMSQIRTSVKPSKSDLILQRAARVGAALVAAASLAVPSEAAAQHRSVAEALNDPHACWIMQRFHRGPAADDGWWETLGEPSPGTDPRFDTFVHGTIRTGGPAQLELPPLTKEAIYPNDSYTANVRIVEVPCGQPYFQRLYVGAEIVNDRGSARLTERLAATDVVTHAFSDNADAFAAGFLMGYKFAPWANNVIVSPFASFDFMHASVNHTSRAAALSAPPRTSWAHSASKPARRSARVPGSTALPA
jgi:hypothetical protein